MNQILALELDNFMELLPSARNILYSLRQELHTKFNEFMLAANLYCLKNNARETCKSAVSTLIEPMPTS